MSVFVWPASFRALAKCNQRGIDKDYGPTGHSGCAEKKSGLALAAGTETYILRHSSIRWHTVTYTNTLRRTRKSTWSKERQTCKASTRGESTSVASV